MIEMSQKVTADRCSIQDFKDLIDETLSAKDVPNAEDVVRNVPIYDGNKVLQLAQDESKADALLSEWNRVLSVGSGVVVFRNAFADIALLDSVTDEFRKIITREESAKKEHGDHFAASGANSRVWNSHEKLCAETPELFIRYNANGIIPLIAKAWLGPNYQVTAQVNVVRPGGSAQVCHRDYHMGFLPTELLSEFPVNAHRLSASLTLQGAVAHSDMPVDSGPTKLLPFSQKYDFGYVSVHLPEFLDLFEERHIQLELKKGDAVFFNPALYHAAGENRTEDVHRIANLLQIGSAFGRSTEKVDTKRICGLIFDPLKKMIQSGALTENEVANVVTAGSEGYPFPTDLDRESPTDSLVPHSQSDILRQALTENWEHKRFAEYLNQM